MNGNSKHYMLANGETVITFEPNSHQGRPCCGRTTLEIVLLFIALIFIGISAALVIVLVMRPNIETIKTITITEYPPASNSVRQDDKKTETLCLTQDCVKAAVRLMEAMNDSIDPCENFFDYACGSWNRMNEIPEDRSSYDTFSKLRDNLDMQLKELLEEPELPGESEGTVKAKRLYASCINEAMIDQRDLGPAIALINDLGGWPVTMGTNWRNEDFDLIGLLAKLRLYNNKLLIDQWVGPDDKNSDIYVIQLDQAELGMSSRDYYMSGRDDPHIVAYEQFAVDTAILFGANASRAKAEMADVIDFEIRLANITVPQGELRDSEALYNKMTIAELQKMIPHFNWVRYLTEIFARAEVSINVTDHVVVLAPVFFSNLTQLLSITENRTLANYLIWRIMKNRVDNLPKKYRELQVEYIKIIMGYSSETSRWRDCVTYVNNNLGNAVGRLFISRHFDENAKKNALEMIKDIRRAIEELLSEVPWMDQRTKKLAKEKADVMQEKIGFPGYILNDTFLDNEYKNIHFHTDTYFENILNNVRGIALSNLQMYNKPVDKTLWSAFPAIVNAFYSATMNQMTLPAGILQPPFYNKGYPKSLNYGGIGMVIGHEITHGFDDRGRQYDKNGNLQQWWDDHVIAAFKAQAKCIIEQYGNFTVEKIGLQLNSVQSQGEDIADNGGLTAAFRAYRMWKAEHGGSEPDLPGLTHLSNDQLFFLNFAQVWCGNTRPEALRNRILTGVHNPGRYRVIGTLQNSLEFRKAFQCPTGSYMAPSKRCSIW
ncbi:neprilysin-1-like isoform X1 [Dreissena polymorpha]|nr:neprilysin-1-like isoform X1 [Dreissena polymorpha]XP_052213120.1 neprilysin-1-like isoform X1 [Dreissena polymorpha]XP_052213121.1 neprilysin-1-like isoform X1 [Dreissena polymorpha]